MYPINPSNLASYGFHCSREMVLHELKEPAPDPQGARRTGKQALPVGVVARVALLDVLLDRVVGETLLDFELRIGAERDLDDHIVVRPLLEGDIVPWRDALAACPCIQDT